MSLDHPTEIYVDGTWAQAGGESIELVDPTTERGFGSCLDADDGAVGTAVASARRAFDVGPWPRLSLAERGAVLSRLIELIQREGEELALLQTTQMGAPLSVARALVGGTARMFRAYLNGAGRIDERYLRVDSVGQSLVTRRPLGVVGVIIPWNGPLSSLVSKALPAVLMGCSVVVKPAPETPLEAGRFAELCREAGVPDGIVNVVTGGAATGEALVVASGVDKITFTGSTAAGRRVGALCGQHLKHVSLELGGKSAAIVLPDADAASTVPSIADGNFFNTGQICVAVSRVLLPAARHDELLEALCAEATRRVIGDPREATTQIGPLVSARQRKRVEDYAAGAVGDGARLVAGGRRPAHLERGWFYEPTIFDGVDPASTLAREEVFGPVMSVMTYESVEEAVEMANDSDYGLHGAVYGADPEECLAVAARIETGSVGLNTANLTPGTPYGGVRSSGVGREHGREGLESFLETRSYVVPPGLARELTGQGVPVS